MEVGKERETSVEIGRLERRGRLMWRYGGWEGEGD